MKVQSLYFVLSVSFLASGQAATNIHLFEFSDFPVFGIPQSVNSYLSLRFLTSPFWEKLKLLYVFVFPGFPVSEGA